MTKISYVNMGVKISSRTSTIQPPAPKLSKCFIEHLESEKYPKERKRVRTTQKLGEIIFILYIVYTDISLEQQDCVRNGKSETLSIAYLLLLKWYEQIVLC